MFSINPFRKRQPMREGQGGGEPYLPPDLERFRNRGTSDAPITPVQPYESPYQPEQTSILEVPEKERKFRAFAREMEPRENIGWDMENPTGKNPAERNMQESGLSQNKQTDDDRLDMVLQKLETIDLRLKLIEQKMERRAV